jgi:isopenicillin N synthase-like dioxygenase
MTKDKYTEFTPEAYPPFPADLPTVPLETIELARLLRDGNTQTTSAEETQREGDRVFDACRGRGFFYLDLRGSAAGEALLRGAAQIALTGEETFELPLNEKMRYRQNSNGAADGSKGGRTLFGYKYVGATVTDRSGTKDTAEFFNVAKDDAVAPDAAARRHPWPAPIEERADLFRGYVETAHGVGMMLLDILARRLGVDPAEFTGKHRIGERAGDHVRITRGPPRKNEEMPEIQTPSHTDFGT